jgi:hypothetical protein
LLCRPARRSLPGGFQNQLRDHIRLRDERNMARFHFYRSGAHAFGHKPLQIRVDGPTLRWRPRRSSASCARPPAWSCRRAATSGTGPARRRRLSPWFPVHRPRSPEGKLLRSNGLRRRRRRFPRTQEAVESSFPLFAFHPSRKHPSAKVRAFVDFCVEITAQL